MATEFKNKMRDLMKRAWMLVKVYGFSMAEAMKQAWLVLKLKAALKEGNYEEYVKDKIASYLEHLGAIKIPEGKKAAFIERRKMIYKRR